VHAANHEFILHFDVDVINSEEFPWSNFPGSGGLSLGEARDALRVFVSQTNLAGFVVAGYNPELDSDGAGARKLIDLLVDVLSTRLKEAAGAVVTSTDSTSPKTVSGEPSSEISHADLPTTIESESGSDSSSHPELPDESEPDAPIS
jgi:hypothetical protein